MTTTETILSAIKAIRVYENQVIEIRALEVPMGRARPAIVAGYFDDHAKLAAAAESLERRRPAGIYTTLNVINPALLARSANRLTDYAKDLTTDNDIERRTWLPIDIDPVRPKGISSNGQEVDEACAGKDWAAKKMREWFNADPAVVGFSGNGYHLLYRMDERQEKWIDEAIKAVLLRLHDECEIKTVSIDRGNFNPARIWKLYGTTARKGDNLPDRPHRRAEILETNSTDTIPESALKDWKPKAAAKTTSASRNIAKGISESADTLADYLQAHGVTVRERKEKGGDVYLFMTECPFISDHGQKTDTAVIWSPDGLRFKCLHDRCTGLQWKDLRRKIHPDYDAHPADEPITGWTPNFDGATTENKTDVPRGTSDHPTTRVANCYTKAGAEGEKIIFAVPITDIATNLQEATGGWPARVSGKLFAPGDPVRILPKHDALFAWMQEAASFYFPRLQGMKTVAHDARTKGTCNLVTRQELFEYLEDMAMPNYAGYETLPHYPSVDGLYYVPCALPAANGAALQEFVARLNAETEIDRMLMEAALLTPGWGGPCGARPAFVFSSQHGRGSGKSKTAERIMQVWGGWVSISADKEDWKEAKQRLMDDSALACRCVYIDNIRHKLSGADLESMITAPVIDAKKMYVGQFSRPNRLTFFLTANTPKLSQDLSDRSVPIKVGKQQHGSDWEAWVERFLNDNRLALLSDIYARIGGQIGCDIKPENRDRWFLWQTAILALFEKGNEMAELIKARRPENDGDLDDAEEMASIIEDESTANGIDPEKTAIRMTPTIFYRILKKYELADKKMGRNGAIGWFKNLIGNGPLKFSRIGKSGNRRFFEYCKTFDLVGGKFWDLIVTAKADDE